MAVRLERLPRFSVLTVERRIDWEKEMPSYSAPAGAVVTMKVRVDKRPYLAGFQTPPQNSTWENITPDADGMGERRDFRMPPRRGDTVSFNGQFDEQIGPNDPLPKATYTITFFVGPAQIGTDQVVVPQGMGPVSRQYNFTAA